MSDKFYQSVEWRRLSNATLRRDTICQTPGCGELSRHADHVTPRKLGGADELWNLRGLCDRCHNARRGSEEPRAKGALPDGSPRDTTHWWNTSKERLTTWRR